MIVNGLINANRGSNQHWSATVNTVTTQVIRTYMEINRDMFEKLSAANVQEEAKRDHKEKQLTNQWAVLERKFGNR